MFVLSYLTMKRKIKETATTKTINRISIAGKIFHRLFENDISQLALPRLNP